MLVAFEAQHGIQRNVDSTRMVTSDLRALNGHKAARFVLVAESFVFVRHLDAVCPTTLREVAVVQQALFGHDGLVEIARSHVSSNTMRGHLLELLRVFSCRLHTATTCARWKSSPQVT